jgi:hypothetical protein
MTAVILSTASTGDEAPAFKQQTTSKDRDRKPQRPVASFSASLPDDPVERALRVARSRRYNERAPVTFAEMRDDTTGYSISSHWWLGLPALPTAESDAVVIGEVVTANGYLSSDRTGAYSEFVIRIDKVFKDDGRLSAGTIVAEREGADVQLPDGRIIRYGIAGQGTPRVSGRYVLFLKYYEGAEVYGVVTGYGLSNGRVFPLDNAIERFTAFENSDEKSFLKAVENAISHPPQAPRDKRRGDQLELMAIHHAIFY